MTNPDDAFWRRPAAAEPDREATPPAAPPVGQAGQTGSGYAGPPASTPPPPGWRPQFVVQPAPPRQLPAQDHADLDAQERSARTLTYGIGLVAGAILLIVLCAICGRALV